MLCHRDDQPDPGNPAVKPELVIFDMDGLILNTEQLFMDLEDIVMQRYGYRQSRENYIKTIGTGGETLRSILRELYGPEYPEETISRETRQLVDEWIEKNGPPVKDGISCAMKRFTQAGISCAVATSTHTEIASHYMEKAGLMEYLRFVLGGENVARSKPDPEIFLMTARKAGVDPSHCLVLEDSPNGIRAALSAGMDVIAIPDLVPVPEELESRIFCQVTSADQVPSLLGLE